ncbi:M48 family metalloprotease [Caulobacter sp. KR2-114]|uniref:M48 family metalloprotease n=1 Tax=Caulobacter sp. KR2-114 TaxID=3400912 RepID=UPI003C10E230
MAATPPAAFDPVEATDLYIDGLSPALRAAGAAYAEQREAAWVLGGVLIIAVALIVMKSRLLPQLAARIEAERPRPWLAGLAGAFVLFLAMILVKLPLDVAVAWLADRTRLGPTAPVGVYLARAWGGDLPLLLGLTVVACGLQGLARALPRTWWAWAGAIAGLALIGLVWGPYAGRAGPAHLPPLPPGPARDGMLSLIHDAGLSARDVYLVASPEVDGDVTGLPGQARVVVNQGMLDHASVPEMRAAIGHLAGHFVRGDQFGFALLLALSVLAGLLAIHRLAGPLTALLGEGAGRGPGDLVALPAALMAAVLAIGASALAERAYDRWINVRADQFSLDHARAPDGLALNLLRGWRDDKVDPGPLEEALFFDHPSLRNRILHAMRWKAGHGVSAAPGPQGGSPAGR